MGKSVYNIAELANVHSGSFAYLEKLVSTFSQLDGIDGIKFQPFKFDCIALPDYKWYPVYQELFFDEQQWNKIITLASKKMHVWIDTFDEYTVKIIRENFIAVSGVKLQASILYNEVVFSELKKLGLKGKKLILNISGLELNEIRNISEKFLNALHPEELILQIGYQAYPTSLPDSGLSKITVLQQNFPYAISFADHLDGKSEEALILPLVAMSQGATYIEKHVWLNNQEEKYDHFSSITSEQFSKLIQWQKGFTETLHADFLVAAERKYLKDSQQIPVTKREIKAGCGLSSVTDLDFKRSNSNGMTAPEIIQLIHSGYVASEDIPVGSVIPAEKLKKATVAAVIACRLKSSRLKKKALLPIGKLSSVELCIKNTMRLKNVNHVVLATSDVEEDAELKNHTYSPSVLFHKGDPLDVIQRYLGILDTIKADILVRITADMPYISEEITSYLLKEHFASGADYTRAIDCAVGTAPEIINVAALRKVKQFFPKADYSEYMTFYFMNNPSHFRIHEVNLPKELVRNYRLTLDYQEDLDLFEKIENHLAENNLAPTTPAIFKYLDEHPEVAGINAHITLAYKTDETLIKTLNEVTTIK